MNGIHDLGGMHGFGPVDVDPNEPRFRAEWERRVFGLNMATLAQGFYNVDENRYARERIHPAEYLAAGYWEQLLAAVETCLVEHDIVTLEELDTRAAELAADPTRPIPVPAPGVEEAVMERLSAGMSRQRRLDRPARFAVGDAVQTRLACPVGHTRLPGYVRGRRGTITRARDPYVLPDTNAHGRGEQPEHLYQVTFARSEVWGAGDAPDGAVVLDLWESYLEGA